jgi:hypothetical protein
MGAAEAVAVVAAAVVVAEGASNTVMAAIRR